MSSPKPSRWSRVGSAVRRSTSLLNVSRPNTPSNAERDSDSTSIRSVASTSSKRKLDTSKSGLLPPSDLAAAAMVPSPIAESPMREAEASREEISGAAVGPSPLAHANTTTTTSTGSAEEGEGVMEPVSDVEVTSSPTGYVPPPLLDSSKGNPGAFTDDSDTLPQPVIIQDPFASRSQVNLTRQQEEGDGGEVTVGVASPPKTPERTAPASLAAAPSSSTSFGEEVPRGVFFGKPMVESLNGHDDDEVAHLGFAAAVEENAELAPPLPITDRSISAKGGDSFQPHPKALEEDKKDQDREYTLLPAYESEIGNGHNVWGGAPTGGVGGASAAESSTARVQPIDDPFGMPTINEPRSNLSHSHMPQPHPAGPTVQVMPVESHRDDHPSILMPLPPFGSVIASQPLHQMPAAPTFVQGIGSSNVGYDTDETLPLLGNRAGKSQAYSLQPNPSNNDQDGSSPLSPWVPSASNGGPHQELHAPRLHELGWLEYHLPDGSFYYVHPTRKVTTDMNLRVEQVLTDVTNHLEGTSTVGAGLGGGYGAPKSVIGAGNVGVEVWLRDVGTKRRFIPARWLVDHHARTVVAEQAGDAKGKGKLRKSRREVANGEDQLDMEYRYWSFMEAHPAHTTLPVKAKNEAMDVLTWAWTDRLLPSNSAVPAPFSQEECQELMTLLRSFNDDNHDDHGIQTRVVSRVLLRVAIWRQMYFRPNKPLPKDVKSPQLLITRRRSFGRTLLDLGISCVCLGLPYLFLERVRNQRLDEEGSIRAAGPVFVIGACTCLVSAIVLSASVTLLSLPGLGSVARIAGLVAVLFAGFSMASTLVAFFRYKTDMERVGTFVGLEGLINISNRAVVMSLPLVFLAYSIIGFIVGIVLYSFSGTSVVDPFENSATGPRTLGDYTRWGAMGILGAVGGVVAIAWLAVRA